MITLHLKEMELIKMLSERLETTGSGICESVNLKYLPGERAQTPTLPAPEAFGISFGASNIRIQLALSLCPCLNFFTWMSSYK